MDFLSIANNLEKILFTFPSNIGVGKSKADEIILPAVLFTTPGREIHCSIPKGQYCGSRTLFFPLYATNIFEA